MWIMAANTLYYGDNLDVLRRYVDDGSVDLIYLDPPFNSNADYNVLFAEQDGTQSAAQIQAFGDTWQWDEVAQRTFYEITGAPGRVADAIVALHTLLGQSNMMAYLVMMAPRLEELRRVLKPTGSLYLHCDPTASHYLKLLMDRIFGAANFVNEIIWQRHNARSVRGCWARIHDTLLLYRKSDKMKFTPLLVPGRVDKTPHTLVTGPDGMKYQTYELTAPGVRYGESGQPWRDFDPGKMGRHWGASLADREAWDKAGLIHWPGRNGFPRRRGEEPFDPTNRRVPVGDIWTDIDRINQAAKERLGYPTQKPEALLERILEASSVEGDVVLDPFCGCGTTIAAAHKLNRRWIGIDITHLAITLIKHRLRDTYRDTANFVVCGEPVDLAGAVALAEEDKYQFQWWALGLVGARPSEEKKGADKGIDGRIYFRDPPNDKAVKSVVISVKGGSTGVAHVRDLRGVVEREKAAVGVLITVNDPTGPMKKEAIGAGYYESPFWKKKYPRLQIFTVEDLLGGKRIEYPPAQQVDATFRRAPKHYKKERQVKLL